MDACFGLVRKKSAGANLLPPRHGDTFFADQDDVDNFVDQYSKTAKEAPTVSVDLIVYHVVICIVIQPSHGVSCMLYKLQ